jgi:peptidylprolyl isomerase
MFKKTQLIALASLTALLVGSPVNAEDYKAASIGNTPSAPATSPKATDKADQIDMKKLSEAFGHFIGRNLQSPGLKFDLESLIKGIREGAAGEPAPLSEKEYEEMMAAVQEKAFKEMSSTNLQAANDFMAKNAHAQGVTELVPGKLQYMVIKEGQGATVTSNSSPMIHYTGKYLDGTVFGTSEEMGGPITIPLNQTIPGFSKGLVGMKEGEKRKLFVHPDLGYGTTGQLPPNELLIFEVEVVKADSEEGHAKDKKAVGTKASSASEEESDDNDDFDFDDEEEDAEEHETTPTQAKAAQKK